MLWLAGCELLVFIGFRRLIKWQSGESGAENENDSVWKQKCSLRVIVFAFVTVSFLWMHLMMLCAHVCWGRQNMRMCASVCINLGSISCCCRPAGSHIKLGSWKGQRSQLKRRWEEQQDTTEAERMWWNWLLFFGFTSWNIYYIYLFSSQSCFQSVWNK